MIGRKTHKEYIGKFHDRMDEVSSEIDTLKTEHGDEYEDYSTEVREELYKLTREYFELIQLWSKIDDFLEFDVDCRMSILKNEPMKNWNQD